jgi:BirA family biotin operon repressor/biotin-[acetyl-CoA-carboxylase] ligase
MLSFQMMVADNNPYESISNDLDTGFIGQRILYFPQLPSTMDAARQEVRRGAAEGTVIIAGEQTAGRGRIKRLWLSPPGNIALSVILCPDIASLPYLVMIASLAVVRSIARVTGLRADIKWPNDVLIGGKKVSGILIENEINGRKTVRAVIGIGINIDLRETVIENSSLPATSLEKEAKQSICKGDLVKCLLTEMERLYRLLPHGGSIFREWRDNLAMLGKRVTVETNEGILEGIAESVDESGSLTLRLDDGGYTRIVAGDVTLRQK